MGSRLNFAGTAPSITMTSTTTADQAISYYDVALSGNLTVSQNSTAANLIFEFVNFITTPASTITISGAGNTTFRLVEIDGGGGVTLAGGSLTLDGGNLGLGPLNLSSGSVNVVESLYVGSLSGAAATTINLSSGVTLGISQSSVSTYSGTIGGQGGLVLALGMQHGTLTLNNANTYTGGTTINTGTLVVELAATTASGSSLGEGPLTINSGTLTFEGSPSMPMTILGALTTGGGAIVNVPNSVPSNFVLAAGSLVQTNAGTIAFAGNSAAPAIQFTTNPATITVNSSTTAATMLPPWALVQFAANASEGDFATATLTGGAYRLGIVPYSSNTLANSVAGDVVAVQPPISTLTTLSANATAYALKVGGGGVPQTLDLGTNTLDLGDAINSGIIVNNSTIQNGTVQLNGAGYVYTSGNSAISAAITGSNGLTVFGPASGGATLTLTSTSNSYGNTNINSNTLVVSSNSNLGPDTLNSNPVSINFYGGQLTIVGTTAFSTAKSVTLNSGTDTIDVENSAGATFSGLFGGGMLNKTGPGQLIIASPQGNLSVVNKSGVFQLGPSNQSNQSNQGIALSVINNGSLIIAIPATISYLSGTGSLMIDGPNRVSLISGTYTGPTNITGGGTLFIGGISTSTGSGAVTIDNGVLQGLGVVGGPITVNANGALEAGAGIAPVTRFSPLRVNANVTINAGGTLNAYFGRTGVGTANANLISLTNPNSANSIFNLNVGSSAFSVALAADPTNTLVPGETYTITLVQVPSSGTIELNSVPVGPNYSFTNSSPGSYDVFGQNVNAMNYSLFVDNTGTQLELTFTVVPEPAHALLVAVAGLLLAAVAVRLRSKKGVPAAAAAAQSF
jgi:fibronectin-binding autotransporter adhesin